MIYVDRDQRAPFTRGEMDRDEERRSTCATVDEDYACLRAVVNLARVRTSPQELTRTGQFT